MAQQKPFNFYKTLVYTAFVFILAVIFIEGIFSLFYKTGFNGFLQNFSYPFIIKYLISKLLGGLVYGLFMAFILKRKAKKMHW